MKAITVKSEKSTVIVGGEPVPHALQGLAMGFIPFILNTDILDGTFYMSKDEPFEYARCIVL
ncbi:MAG: hypothetical protein ABI045_06995 [Flavobacteriales bacterium]